MSDPISSRLDRIHDQWVEFIQLPDARLLRWMLATDELRMVETFLETESDARAGELPDLFMICPERFLDVDSYGAALRAEIIRQYDEARPGLESEGVDASWNPPPCAPGLHSLAHLIDACASLRDHGPNIDAMALVLLPAEVSDYEEWQRWLRGAALYLPSEVRLIVVDDAEEPALQALAAAEPVRVHSVAADLGMPSFLPEMARMAGTSGPDGAFRVQFTTMTCALGAGEIEKAGEAARHALEIAGGQGWLHLTGAVHFAMAAGLMNAGRTEEALASYRDADVEGKRLSATDAPLGSRIRLSAAFGVGSALLGSGEFARAAGVYEVAAPMAATLNDAWLLTDCWRMASYCREQTGEPALAWERGFAALTAAEGIPQAQRAKSTVPFIRESLIRLAGGSEPHVEAVETRVAALLGEAAPQADAMPVPQP